MAALSNHEHPHKCGSMAPQRNGTNEMLLSIRGLRHSIAQPAALRADSTGMDKLSAKHPADSSKGSATSLFCNIQQRIQILPCETFVT